MKYMMFVCALTLFASGASASFSSYYNDQVKSALESTSSSQAQVIDLLSSLSRKNLHPLGYKRGSKKALFGYVHLERDQQGYFVKDVYCNRVIRNRVGPNRIPNNNVMNTEHTWPQSKGSKREPFRGDLHHLYPTDSKANSKRSSHPFGEVSGTESAYFGCEASKIGSMINPETGRPTHLKAFQPPAEHRGNVARALFYSAVVYNHHISSMEEHYLRKWHKEDPVDQQEKERNDAVEESQGNRNPFVDFPTLVENIQDF